MRSVRSWFNPTLFWKNLTRFWPIWGLYLVIWAFALPVALVLDEVKIDRFIDRYLLSSISAFGLPLAVCFGLLAACAVWSYLYNTRSACLMHSLPIRREGLFLTNFLSGLAFFVGPNLVVFLLTALAEGSKGRVDVGGLVLWLVSVTLMELFFFCFATFCAMFTGHMLGLPAFYAIANVLVAGVTWLLNVNLSSFVFGYVQPEGLGSFARWMTPAWKLLNALQLRHVAETDTYRFGGLGYILIYVFFGLILLGIALAVYVNRDMERAGDVVSVPQMRPAFQYGVAFCCALAFGTFLYVIFYEALPEGVWTLLILMLICGAAGYFAARMLLEKSFRVFYCWKGCLPFLAALVALACIMEFDLLGYERRVPSTADVSCVEVTLFSTAPYDTGSGGAIKTEDPEILQAVIAVHQSVVDNKREIEAAEISVDDQDRWSSLSYFQVDYTLQSGKVLSRIYSDRLPLNREDLDDPDTLTGRLDALVNLIQVRQEVYGLDDYTDDQLVGMELTGFQTEDTDYTEYTVSVSRSAREAILQAVRADLADGSLGRRYLLNDQERRDNCFINDLKLTFNFPVEEEGDLNVSRPEESETVGYSQTITVTLTLQTTATRTLAALQQAGVLEEPIQLFTHTQWNQAVSDLEREDGTWQDGDLDAYAWAILGKD
jgi:ABC-2 type transport system permease protein